MPFSVIFRHALTLLLLCGFSSQTVALTSDLLIVLDPDGRGFTVQHTVSTNEEIIQLIIPDSVKPINVQFFGPQSQLLTQQHSSSPDSIELDSGVVVIRYRHRLQNNLRQLENTHYQLTLLPLPVSIRPDDAVLELQTTTWLFPSDLILENYIDPDQVGSWREETATLQFESAQSSLTQQIITFSWLDQDGDGIRDSDDRCNATPAGYPVDLQGCTLDADSDGVADGVDECLDSIAGYPVDTAGCSLDFDNDGIPNPVDQCRGTAAGQTVDSYGCESDTDLDGIADQRDNCPATPEHIDVDLQGCPFDKDGDAVPDYRDICLDSLREQRVGDFGCRQSARPVVIKGISFLTGSSNLSVDTREVLIRVAAALHHHSSKTFEIGAHTDDQGTRRNNRALSERRARSVRQYLMIKGISANRIVAKGYGESTPLVPNSSLENRRVNRRIELIVLP